MDTALIQIGDFHAKPDARNAARYAALDQIIDAAVAMPRLGAILWPGDLNDGRMAIEDKIALCVRVQAMAMLAPVVICYGNHDLPGDIEFLSRLKATHPIYVIDRPQTLQLRLATGERAAIFVLPYPTKAGLTALGVAKPDVVDVAADALDAIFMKAADELNEARLQGALTLMIGHVNVAGSLTSVGQPNVGHEIEISPRHLDRLGNIYKGLNHIHKAQEIAGAHYAGSVCRLNWGEIEEKRWLEVRVGWEQFGPDEPHRQATGVISHPIAVAPMYHVEGVLTRDGFTWQVTNGPNGDALAAPASWRGCEVRVRYRFQQTEKSILRDALVLAEFAEAAKLEIEPIAVTDRAPRAPEVAEARTLPDKVRAWAKVNNIEMPDAVIAKLARLEHSDALQLLSDVQTALAALGSGEGSIDTPQGVTVQVVDLNQRWPLRDVRVSA